MPFKLAEPCSLSLFRLKASALSASEVPSALAWAFGWIRPAFTLCRGFLSPPLPGCAGVSACAELDLRSGSACVSASSALVIPLVFTELLSVLR